MNLHHRVHIFIIRILEQYDFLFNGIAISNKVELRFPHTGQVMDFTPGLFILPDFLDFAGDSVLVGYNCITFDKRYMIRAGRYSHRIIENKLFDVMKYSKKFLSDLGIEKPKGNASLEELSKKFNIKNPRAHRALADAIMTVKVFLKLKEMENKKAESNVDDLLNDIDNW